jgi:hypothetical protein
MSRDLDGRLAGPVHAATNRLLKCCGAANPAVGQQQTSRPFFFGRGTNWVRGRGYLRTDVELYSFRFVMLVLTQQGASDSQQSANDPSGNFHRNDYPPLIRIKG